MATQYNFNVDDGTTVLDHDQIWEQENCNEQDESHYSDAVDVTLTEGNNKSCEDTANDTHYFSILDNTNDLDLNDISQATLDESGMINVEHSTNQMNTVDMGGQEIVLFRIDGSDDLYGLQVAQDEEGNLQKLQFKVKQNEEGNFEAIPESVQLSPIDCDLSQIMQQQTLTTEAIEETPKDTLIKTCFTEDNDVSINNRQEFLTKTEHVEEDEEEEEVTEYEYVDEIDIKPNVLSKPFIEEMDNIEKIIQRDEHSEEEEDSVIEKKIIPTLNENEETYEEVTSNLNKPTDEVDEEKELCSDDNIEHIFVKDGTILDERSGNRFKIFEGSEDLSQSSQEEYGEDEIELEEIEEEEECYTELDDIDDEDDEEEEEEYHIINNGENNVIMPQNSIETHRILKVQRQPELLRDQTQVSKLNTLKNSNRKVIVLKSIIEKENLSHNVKTNPRSILKSSQPYLKRTVESKSGIQDERFEKRFAKSKEAIRAKLFQNFIAQTKIIEAPIRTERLPRKQVIRPVSRTDEEIIVQEVYVPSNGYHQNNQHNEELRTTNVSETIQLSDSDEDYDPRKSNNNNQIKRKRKRRRSLIEIIITDSSNSSDEESDPDTEDIFDLNSSLSDSDIEKIIVDKKKRGRPPKKNQIEDDVQETLIPVKRGRGRPPKNKNEDLRKLTNKCPKCPKSFPSTSSLKTHLQYHNFKESNKRLAAAAATTASAPVNTIASNIASLNRCDSCNETFKNHVQLTKHKNTMHYTKIICNICKKEFFDKTQLSTHRRSHLKEQMFKSTVTVDITPSKLKQSKKQSSSTASPLFKQLKCWYCRKILPTQLLLNSHIKNNHKCYKCKFCNESFVSKFILDNHVSKNCVKNLTKLSTIAEESIKSSNNKKIVNSQRKTFHSQIPKVSNVKNVRKSSLIPVQQRNITLRRKSTSIVNNTTKTSTYAGLRLSRNLNDINKKLLKK